MGQNARNLFDGMKNLEKWQEQLSSLVLKVTLLIEIPLTEQELREIEEDLKGMKVWASFVRLPLSPPKATPTQSLFLNYPAVMAVYLAYKAAYNDQASFWKALCNDLEWDIPTSEWGQLFLELLDRWGLPIVRGKGHKYVQNFRLHGGIPAYSLPDYFEHVVIPTVVKTDYRDLSDIEALRKVKGTSAFKFSTDKPVRLFIEEATQDPPTEVGKVALKWFRHAREAVRRLLAGEAIDDIPEAGLRPYIRDALVGYWQERETFLARKRARHGWRPPYLLYDGDASFRIALPEQQIRQQQPASLYRWRVYSREGLQGEKSLRVYRRGAQVWIRGSEITIEDFGEQGQLRITLESLAEGKWRSIRQWVLRGRAYQMPLMAFRYQDGRAVLPASHLPAEACWLLTPEGFTLNLIPTEFAHEVEYPMASPTGWQAKAYNLSRISVVEVFNANNELIGRMPVREKRRPLLEGQRLPEAQGEVPWYVGSLPDLLLPITSPTKYLPHEGTGPIPEWSVELCHAGPAFPRGVWHSGQGAFSYTVEEHANGYWLRVSLSKVQGSQQEYGGIFRVSCFGPQVPQWSEMFAVWPELRIHGLDACYGHTEDNVPPEVRFFVHTFGRLESSSDIPGISISLRQSEYEVKVPPQGHEIILSLHWPERQIQGLALPLRIPKPRWRLMGSEETDWTVQPLWIELEKILHQIEGLHLVIEFPFKAIPKDVTFVLLDTEAQQVLLRLDERDLPLKGQRISFSLRRIVDTLVHVKEDPSVMFLLLEVQWSLQGKEYRAALLRIGQGIQLALPPWIEFRRDIPWVHWFEPNPLRHRHLILWSHWQPWTLPITVALPNDPEPGEGEGWWTAPLAVEGVPLALPPGKYHFLLTTALPWEKVTPPERPPLDNPALQTVTTLSPEQRLHQLEQAAVTPLQAFRAHFERAAIATDILHLEARNNAIQWMVSHWQDATPDLLLGLYRWLLEDERDTHTAKAIRTYLFREEMLERVAKRAQHMAEEQARAFVASYLAPLREHPKTPLKPSAMVRLLQLLKIEPDPPVMALALNTLLKAQDATFRRHALTFILSAVNDYVLSPEEAVDFLLQSDLPSTIQEACLDTLLVDFKGQWSQEALIDALAERNAFPHRLVRPGAWVQSEAGWGRIEQIIIDGQPRDLWIVSSPSEQLDQMVVLEVALRAGTEHEEKATLNLSAKQIQLQGANSPETKGWMCTRCKRFITQDENVIRTQHNWAAHDGIQPALRRIPLSRPLHPDKLRFAAEPPKNPFA